jgi:hypothetical protein
MSRSSSSFAFAELERLRLRLRVYLTDEYNVLGDWMSITEFSFLLFGNNFLYICRRTTHCNSVEFYVRWCKANLLAHFFQATFILTFSPCFFALFVNG